MSLYLDFLHETGLIQIIESDSGFATFMYLNEECYIENIYVIPELRRSRLAWDMADQIAEKAKAKGCKYLTGSVNTKAKNCERSLSMLISYGMKFIRIQNDMIYMGKELI